MVKRKLKKLFWTKSLGFQITSIVLVILVIPVFFILYDTHFAGKKEEITFMAMEERIGTIVEAVMMEMNAQILANEQDIARMSTEERGKFFAQIFSDAAKPVVELNPGVRLSLYIPNANDMVVRGFLHNYRQLSAEEQKEREKRIFNHAYTGIRSVLASGETISALAGEPTDRFFEYLVPVRAGNEIVAVLWADELLHPIFTQAQQFRVMTRYLSLAAILIGGFGIMLVLNNLTTDVRRIKKGLELLEKDFNHKLPEMPGEMGKIARAINKMAHALAEKERLEEEMQRQERLAALGQVVTGVAHELRNPIGVIKTTVQLMEKEVDESAKEYCSVIKQQVDRQNKVIQELLAYGRPSKPVKENVQVNNLLNSVLTFIHPQLRQSSIKLKTNFNNDLPLLFIDAERIKQVFVNLILNAVHAMPEGGELSISTDFDQDKVIISFKDTGIGISDEEMKKVFDPFFTTKDSGTGLGLTICNQILQMHNGSISAQKNIDTGMTFTVILPISNEAEGV